MKSSCNYILQSPSLFCVIFILSDKATGRLALVFELMDMNIYELIRGRKMYLWKLFCHNSYINHWNFDICGAWWKILLQKSEHKGVFLSGTILYVSLRLMGESKETKIFLHLFTAFTIRNNLFTGQSENILNGFESNLTLLRICLRIFSARVILLSLILGFGFYLIEKRKYWNQKKRVSSTILGERKEFVVRSWIRSSLIVKH